MTKTAAGANPVLNYHCRATTPSALTPYLALLTNVESETESAYTDYARVALSTSNFGNAAASGSIANTAAIAFPSAGSAGSDIIGTAIFDASSGGNLLRKSYLVSGNYYVFTAASSTDVFTAPGHGLSDGDRVVLLAQQGVNLPAGVTQGTLYYVVSAVGATSFKVSLTAGGAAIDVTVFGAGFCAKVIPQAVLTSYIPTFETGALTFNEL